MKKIITNSVLLNRHRTVFSSVAVLFVLVGYWSLLFKFHFNHTPKAATQVRQISSIEDIYSEKIRPILNSRCIACHSCLESPCQLNLQSFEGLQRGGIKNFSVYYGSRLKDAMPTRMFEDAQTTEEWRNKGFHDVIGNSQFSIINHLITMGAIPQRGLPHTSVEDSQICVKDEFDVRNRSIENSEEEFNRLSMPYGLPGLTPEQRGQINYWLSKGAPGPTNSEKIIPNKVQDQIKKWQNFLNANSLKHKITARYLYEHLFLAHIYFKDQLVVQANGSNDVLEPINDNRLFFKMIRSSTACEQGPKIIPTRKPNDDPGVKQWYYCLVPEKNTIVDKTHIPYEFSAEKLKWIESIFISKKWRATRFPSFDPEVAGNPFITFREMPVISRYQFLLNDAQYHVMTFIKGPVCNGTKAVNSIQDQFYTIFINPKSELMAIDRKFAHLVEEDLILPGIYGTEVHPTKLFSLNKELVKKRNDFRQAKQAFLKKHRPNGLTLNDIWNGEQTNDNAMLTILRHDQSSRVVKGAFGDISKTVFVVDYSILERLVYNLVVNFDVYGNVGHQYLTRIYMDLIRMEAENNFLDFLPTEHRAILKNSWYQGAFTQLKLDLYKETEFSPIPAGIAFTESNVNAEPNLTAAESSKAFLLKKIILQHFSKKVRGPIDNLNWKKLTETTLNTLTEKTLSQITSTTGSFNEYFPDLSILFITKDDQIQSAYSIVHNKEHTSISWILGESLRLSPEEDTLSVARGYYGSYPNQFFSVKESELQDFVDAVKGIQKSSQFEKLIKRFGVQRMHPDFWKYYDFTSKDFLQLDPISAGYLDLSRYAL